MMKIGYGDDDGDYDDKDYFRMNIISTLLSNSKSYENGEELKSPEKCLAGIIHW